VPLSKAALFTSGVFFGGAVDHAIAARRRDVTPYGVKSGVDGNWLFAAMDLVVAGVLYRLHTRKESVGSFDGKPLRR